MTARASLREKRFWDDVVTRFSCCCDIADQSRMKDLFRFGSRFPFSSYKTRPEKESGTQRSPRKIAFCQSARGSFLTSSEEPLLCRLPCLELTDLENECLNENEFLKEFRLIWRLLLKASPPYLSSILSPSVSDSLWSILCRANPMHKPITEAKHTRKGRWFNAMARFPVDTTIALATPIIPLAIVNFFKPDSLASEQRLFYAEPHLKTPTISLRSPTNRARS
ncbi:hypothetical protein M758_4G139200 [Ceratodon purpureus]|uniref:Uncharacterized protein n=1 Tax=Ceratodon purpureus TaxID=3225 RepID=A0A8T0IAK3_CERPU|nr:hypothetical protein KC19_4G137800 [Ceratodon purpureus]KAG0619430.1 hypothetical protein M758_4G139200 [Ceratodon purpureus]